MGGLTLVSRSAPGSSLKSSRRPMRPPRRKTPDQSKKDFNPKKKFLKGLQMGPHDPNTAIKVARLSKGNARQRNKVLREWLKSVHQSKRKFRKGLRMGPHDSGV